jgi:hypothetical protein
MSILFSLREFFAGIDKAAAGVKAGKHLPVRALLANLDESVKSPHRDEAVQSSKSKARKS